MENIYLTYYTIDPGYTKKQIQTFYEYQEIIKEDFKRFRNFIDDFPYSKEKENLLWELNFIISSITKNRISEYINEDDDLEMELKICIQDNYLIFTYYPMNEKNETIFDTPSVVIFTRDMKKIYFIDEEYSVFREEEQDDEYNRGHQEINYFEIDRKNKKIIQKETSMEEYTLKIQFGPYNNIKSFENKLIRVLKKA